MASSARSGRSPQDRLQALDIDRWDGDAAQLSIKFGRTSVEQELADLLGRPVVTTIDFQLAFPVDHGPGRRWMSVLSALLQSIDAPRGPVGLCQTLEHSLISGLLISQLHSYTEQLTDDPTRRAPRTAVDRVVEEIQHAPDRSYTLAVLELVRSGLPAALDAGTAAVSGASGPPVPLDSVRLLPPLAPPTVRDFVAFEEHVEGVVASVGDGAGVVPEWYEAPTFYFTNPYALVGAQDDVPVPPGSQLFDFECEVAVVVGRDGSSLTPEQARDHVFGYTVLNDWSARDLQRREMKVQPGPGQGQGLRHHARALARHRRRARALPGRRRVPRPGHAGLGQRRRDRPGPAVQHGLAVRGPDLLRLPRHLGAAPATSWAPAPAATAAASPSCGAAAARRPRRRCGPATWSR